MSDYIRTYLGLMGSGKTTQALRDLEKCPRVLVYSPMTTNQLMNAYPYIYDTPEYLQTLEKFLQVHPRLRVEKRANPSDMFTSLSRIRGYAILLDDVAALKTHAWEKNQFESFIRTVRYNGNQVIITTHRARKDLPPLVQTIGTSFYYVGPGSQSRREIETLYDLVNHPISIEEFTRGITTNPSRGIYPIRRA